MNHWNDLMWILGLIDIIQFLFIFSEKLAPRNQVSELRRHKNQQSHLSVKLHFWSFFYSNFDQVLDKMKGMKG